MKIKLHNFIKLLCNLLYSSFLSDVICMQKKYDSKYYIIFPFYCGIPLSVG